jgi:bla regulator protein blaR1
MSRMALAVVAVLAFAAVLRAQAVETLPSFEAASIKPSDPNSQGQSIRRQPGGRFSTSNMPVRELVRFAYGVQDFQLDGVPAWARSERWDVTAKAEGDPPPTLPGTGVDPMTLMLRSLLIDRFKLAAHRETRELPIYALVRLQPDRLGPRLEPSTVDCEKLIAERMAAARAGGTLAAPPPDVNGRPTCGIRGGFGTLAGNGFPLNQLASTLAQLVGRTVIDRSGLTGTWGFDLKFAIDPNQLPFAPPPGQAPPPADPDSPSIFKAVEEQLGLKLESTKGPVDMVIVDRLERPTPD